MIERIFYIVAPAIAFMLVQFKIVTGKTLFIIVISTLVILLVGLAILKAIQYFINRRNNAAFTDGGLYWIKEGDKYKVIKVLAQDDFSVHIKLYTNRFNIPPTTAMTKYLTIKMDEKDLEKDKIDVGAAHLPIAKTGLATSRPTLFAQEVVTDDELAIVRGSINQ
ncbi:MAG: hypothetical protein OEW15_17185 [Nitrospirota bacterium]|nr:hypothetical protein [Nitrospirota bacterium]